MATLDTHVHADHVTGAWLLKQRCGSRILLSAAAGAANADRLLRHGDRVAFGTRHLEVRATPGHTNGCLTYVLDDHRMAFTGDCLLIRGCGRTDFQQGSPHALYRSVHEQILSLPDAACSTRRTTTAASRSPAWRRRGASTRGWAATSTRPTSPAT